MTPPPILQKLERFKPEEARILAQWLEKNPVGANLGLRLLELLEDLTKKEGRPIADFMADIPPGDKLQPKERGRLWRQSLERRLHPGLKAHAEAFAAEVRSLGLPEGAAIEPPQNFEGRNFTLQVAFSDKEELRRRLRALEKSLEEREWNGLWKF
jgi:hypothetical protein